MATKNHPADADASVAGLTNALADFLSTDPAQPDEVAEATPGYGAAGDEWLSRRVREGLPYATLERLARRFRLRRGELIEVLDLSPRTLSRRSREGRLTATESDRLFRVLRVALLAARTLGSEDRAADWLHRPNRALGGPTPLSRLDTTIGSLQVEQILGRIEHGIHS